MARPKRPSDSKEKKAEYRQRYNERHPDRRSAQNKAYRLKNQEKMRTYQASWYQLWKADNPDEYKQKMKEQVVKYKTKRNTYNQKYRQDRKRQVWSASLKRQYGITGDQYDAMFAKQHGLCAICNRSERRVLNERITKLEVDHNHQTGNVRKLLCHACNVSVGFMDESPDRMRRMIQYIEEHEQLVFKRGGAQ